MQRSNKLQKYHERRKEVKKAVKETKENTFLKKNYRISQKKKQKLFYRTNDTEEVIQNVEYKRKECKHNYKRDQYKGKWRKQ